jgi:hypothetical protein
VGITPQDWRVTANLEIDRCLAAMGDARTADITMNEVVQACGLAYEAAAAAVGALVEAALLDGEDPRVLRGLLGFPPDDDPHRRLEIVREVAAERLRVRLPDA